MKKTHLSLLALSTSLFFYTPDLWAETNNHVSSNIGVFSQYAFRGITQSDEEISLQGGFDLEHSSGFYAGVWGSNVDFNDGDAASTEFDFYAGYSGNVTPKLSYDLGSIFYYYPGADGKIVSGEEVDYDFVEVTVGLSYAFEEFDFSLSLNYSPDYFGGSGQAFYYASQIDAPLPYDINFTANLGYQTIEDEASFGVGDDYYDWMLGFTYPIHNVDLSLQYVDTSLDEPSECADGCDSKVIIGLSRQF